MYDKKMIFIAGLVSGAVLFIVPGIPSAADFPDVIEINDLGNIYEPVVFDHAMHTDIASCAACHHHTTGTPAEDEKCLPCHQEGGTAAGVACGGCHARQVWPSVETGQRAAEKLFHLDPAGLKRAYHVRCLGCHQEMEAASGCEDCHPKKDAAEDVAHVGN